MKNFKEVLRKKYGRIPEITEMEKKEYKLIPSDQKILGDGLSTYDDHLDAQEMADISRLVQIAEKSGDLETISVAIQRFYELTGKRVKNLQELSRSL